MREELRFNLNGRSIVVKGVDPETTLAFYLRNVERLTGTKIGCGEGVCGACTVVLGRWQDGKAFYGAVNACVTPLFAVDGLFVVTVEGIGSTRRLHVIQERLASGHGTQCGFCSPGFVMSAYALLRNSPNPTRKQILEAVRGNLCRCTGYRPILEALYSFSEGCCQGKAGSSCPCLNGSNGTKEETKLVDFSTFPPIDSSQELIFPPELMNPSSQETMHLKGERVGLFVPNSEDDLHDLLKQFPNAAIISSGMIIRLKVSSLPSLEPTTWISVSRCFNFISIDENFLAVGASATLQELFSSVAQYCNSPISKAFNRLSERFSSTQIMNLASWSGSLCTNGSDLSVLARALRLKLSILTGDTEIEVDIEDFYKGTAPRIIKAIKIPLNFDGDIWYQKAGERRGPDSSVVTIAAVDSEDRKAVVLGLQGTSLIAGNLASLCRETTTAQRQLALDEDLQSVREKLGEDFDFVRDLTRGMVARMGENEEEEEELAPAEETAQIYEGSSNGDDAVGRPLRHDFAPFSVTGEAVYVGDIAVPDAVHLGYVVSKEAHAEFTVDPSEALNLPGVIGYWDYNKVPGNNRPGLELHNILQDNTAFFAEGVAEYHSQLIGVVAAKDAQTAARAAKLVKVEYKKLPAILSYEDAISAKSNLSDPIIAGVDVDEVEKALKDAEMTIEGEIYIGGQEHMYLEPQTAVVVPGEGGFLTIYAATQAQTALQNQAAAFIGIPTNNIVVKTKRLGGAFGGKCTHSMIPGAVPALVAYQLRKPVWSVYHRDVDFRLTGKRHPFYVKYRAGFNRQGRLSAVYTKMYSDGGYSIDHSVVITMVACFGADACYDIPVMRAEAIPLKTNKCSQTAFRGFGNPQAHMAMEAVLQQIASVTGRPIDEVKEINMKLPGGKTLMGADVKNESMIRCWEEVKELAKYEHLKAEVELFNRSSKDKKRGIGTKTVRYGLTHDMTLEQATALVQIYLDGSVAISIGGIEMGQGIGTKCRQVCSRALGVPVESVMLLETGTDKTANSPETAASQGTDLHGKAIQVACEKLLEGLRPVMDVKKPWKEVIWAAHEARLPLQATEHIRVDRSKLGLTPGMPHYFTCGAAVAVVELDCVTGDHKLLSVDIVMDLGKSLNPAIDIGQVEGAFIQGYGLMTCENLKWDDDGKIEASGFYKYKIPTAAMCPSKFHVKLLDKSEAYSPAQLYSSKGIGEPPLILGIAAHAALRDALRGYGIPCEQLNSPLTKRELLKILRKNENF